MDQHTHCSPDHLMPAPSHHPVQGRGAVDNPTGRFESIEVVHNPEEDWPETLSDPA